MRMSEMEPWFACTNRTQQEPPDRGWLEGTLMAKLASEEKGTSCQSNMKKCCIEHTFTGCDVFLVCTWLAS